jgi:hypothetical protein
VHGAKDTVLLGPVSEIAASGPRSLAVIARTTGLCADAAAVANVTRTRVARGILMRTGSHRLIGFRVIVFPFNMSALMIPGGRHWLDVAQDAVRDAIVSCHGSPQFVFRSPLPIRR